MTSIVPSMQRWWVYALAGAVSIVFGVATLIWPSITLFVLILMFGFYTIVEGVVALAHAFRVMGEHRTWWPSLVWGVLSLAAGVFVLIYPGMTTLLLLYTIAIWAIVTGFVLTMGGLLAAEILVLVAGVLSILFGFVLLGNPARGALAFVIVIGVFAIVRGVMLLIEAMSPPSISGVSR